MMRHRSQLTSWSLLKSMSLSHTLHLSPAHRTCTHGHTVRHLPDHRMQLYISLLWHIRMGWQMAPLSVPGLGSTQHGLKHSGASL